MADEAPVAVDTNTDETVVLDEATEVEALKVSLAEAEEAKRQLTARAHKAEAEVKAHKATKAEAPPLAPNALSADDVDVKILQSQGADEATIEYLKKIAKVNGTSVLAAQSDDLFVAFKEKKEREDKAQKASIGASKGSGSSQKGKTVATPGLTDEEHKDLWRQANGR